MQKWKKKLKKAFHKTVIDFNFGRQNDLSTLNIAFTSVLRSRWIFLFRVDKSSYLPHWSQLWCIIHLHVSTNNPKIQVKNGFLQFMDIRLNELNETGREKRLQSYM